MVPRPADRLVETPEQLLERLAAPSLERIHRQRFEAGWAEGTVEGKAEGRAETILRMLTKRFGPVPVEIDRCVRGGTTADLDRWTDRILDAATLDAVFGV